MFTLLDLLAGAFSLNYAKTLHKENGVLIIEHFLVCVTSAVSILNVSVYINLCYITAHSSVQGGQERAQCCGEVPASTWRKTG